MAAVVLAVAVRYSLASVAYQPPPFDRYQVILDRMPFGLPPANFDPNFDPDSARAEAQAQAEQQRLAQQINMSAVAITPGGKTAIGFTDLNTKPPVNYYLLVGESSNGWQVKEADFDAETATIEKDGVSITLKLGQGLVADSGSDGGAAPGNGAGVAAPGSGRPIRASAAARQAVPTFTRSTTRSAPGLTTVAAGDSGEQQQQRSVPLRSAGASPAAAAQRGGSAGTSYRERLTERVTRQNEVNREMEKKQREQLERLAREVAQSEIARREAEAAEAALIEQQEDVYIVEDVAE